MSAFKGCMPEGYLLPLPSGREEQQDEPVGADQRLLASPWRLSFFSIFSPLLRLSMISPLSGST